MMEGYKKFGIVAGQVYAGLGFALVGLFIEVIIYSTIAATQDRYLEVFGTIMNSWFGFSSGFLFGISFFGYRFLKTEGKQNEIVRFLLISAFGTCIGFLALYFLMSSSLVFKIPNPIIYLFFGILPFTGVAIGTILVLTRDDKNRTDK